jgi:hypothetical protein
MKALTNEQLKAIEKLSGMIVPTRAQLAEGLCEALGEEWAWSNGYVNGNGNSIALYCENSLVQIGTYRFKDPKSVAIKYMMFGEYVYDFDYYGKVTNAMKEVRIVDGDSITVKYESIA